MVTGASAGLGRAIAHALADRGDRVALPARNREGLEAAAQGVRARGEQPRYRLTRRPKAQYDDVHLFDHHPARFMRSYAPDAWGGDVIAPWMSPRWPCLLSRAVRITRRGLPG